ncbi:unnamed protein product [Gordionus sp. m RMFG-2023]
MLESPLDINNPEDPLFAQRNTFYIERGKSLLLKCPRKHAHTEVVWKNGTAEIHRKDLVKSTKGRMFIDKNYSLHFRKLRFTDSNIWSCWKGKKLLSTARLTITPDNSSDMGSVVFALLILSSAQLISHILGFDLGNNEEPLTGKNSLFLILTWEPKKSTTKPKSSHDGIAKNSKSLRTTSSHVTARLL